MAFRLQCTEEKLELQNCVRQRKDLRKLIHSLRLKYKLKSVRLLLLLFFQIEVSRRCNTLQVVYEG